MAEGTGLRVAVEGSASSADEVEFVREAERLGADSASRTNSISAAPSAEAETATRNAVIDPARPAP